MKIAVLVDTTKYQFQVNLTNGYGVYFKRGFRNPVKALAYVGQLQAQGHIEDGQQVSELVKLAEIWRENS